MDMAGVDFFLNIDGCGDELCRAIGEGRDGMVASLSITSPRFHSGDGEGWSSCLDKMRAPASGSILFPNNSKYPQPIVGKLITDHSIVCVFKVKYTWRHCSPSHHEVSYEDPTGRRAPLRTAPVSMRPFGRFDLHDSISSHDIKGETTYEPS